jgi:hypothetical protein
MVFGLLVALSFPLTAQVRVESSWLNLEGWWDSNIGVTYAIKRSGDEFRWVDSHGVRGVIKVAGDVLTVTWVDQAGQAMRAQGRVTLFDETDQPTRIEMDNGVILFRPLGKERGDDESLRRPATRQTSAEQLKEAVGGALGDVSSYQVRIEQHGPPDYVWDTTFDLENSAAHSVITIVGNPVSEMELYHIGSKAYGSPLQANIWLPVAVPGPPTSRLHAMTAILLEGDITAVREEKYHGEPCWSLHVVPPSSLLENAVEKLADVISPLAHESSDQDHVFDLDKLDVRFEVDFIVNKRTSWVAKAITELDCLGRQTRTTYEFNNFNAPNLAIQLPPDAQEAEGSPLPFGLLFVTPPDMK